MQRCLAVVVAVVMLAGSAPAAGPSHYVVLKESAAGFGAGVVVGLVGFTGVSYGAFLNREWGSGGLFSTAGYTVMGLAPAACATGVSLVGRRYLQHGSFLASVGGSYVGAGAGVGLFVLAMREYNRPGGVKNLHYVAAALTPFMMTAGGVVGYNLTRPKQSIRGSIEDRLEMPALGFRATDIGDGQSALAADLRLVSFRF